MTESNISRRDFLKLSGLALLGLSLPPFLTRDTPQPVRPDSSTENLVPEERLDRYLQIRNEGPGTNQGNLNVINDSNSSNEEFIEAINKWHGNIPIFVFLDNEKVQTRFIKHVLEVNQANKHKYETSNSGSDVNKDGIVELHVDSHGNVINELGQIVDKTSYICSDFSVALGNQIGLNPEVKYNKLTLSLFCVDVSPSQYESSGKPGHAINAIFLSKRNEIWDPQNWIFVEPQNDQILLDPLNHWVNGQALWIYAPGKDVSSTFDSEKNSLRGFMAGPNRKSSYSYDVSRREMIIIKQMEEYLYEREYPVLIDGKPSYVQSLDYTKFGSDEIYGAFRLTTELKYFSGDKVSSALKDAKLPEGFSYTR